MQVSRTRAIFAALFIALCCRSLVAAATFTIEPYIQAPGTNTLTAISEPCDTKRLAEAQPRYRAKAEPAVMESFGVDKVRLVFQHPRHAIAPGQICAFYNGGRLLGGGVFESAKQ
jgi:tRNA U34 2-thiouridine synthase MnmA/TrmU